MSILIKSTTVGMLLLSSVSFNSQATQVGVQWGELGKFTDISAANQPRKSFKANLVRDFERYFVKLAKALPHDYEWHINVTDIDLAGDVNTKYSTGTTNFRVMDNHFKTKVAFSYQLIDGQGNIVASADEVLYENSQAKFPSRPMMRQNFAYEKHMLKKWFNKTLMAKVESAGASQSSE
ncbi:MAG: hypothetical protein ACI8WB_000364 [Phenylobacterium sp.]|jgi:hypothetical protein